MRGAVLLILTLLSACPIGGCGKPSPPEAVAGTRPDSADSQSARGSEPAGNPATRAVPPNGPSAAATPGDHAELRIPGLENVRRVAPGVYSGGEPGNSAAFHELARLGVRTVLSVDGARPALEAARAAGLRYVHIPIGYDSIPENAARALTRLARDIDGPIYVHCHHGKHRGPAAAAIVCRAAGHVDAAGASEILEQAGTSRDYAGLWRDVAAYVPPPENAKLPELVEVAQVNSLAAAMAAIDRAFDNLKLCRDAGWQTPADHPDLVPSREAVLLKEGFREAGRNLSDDCDERFRAWLSESESVAAALTTALANETAAKAPPLLTKLSESCRQCHARYRD